ncbi:putative cardiolipin synthase YwiE [Rubripirellula amarantea]|uniref:Cardiolipin synthase n=1 Tax=Rubripirellula amarantea TaxID=2527999 RepID=A0A5C5WVX1_9BACT|nr:cardiolipin synthase [Rubripirellula amarantea]TWT54710.1 putative cardiolipin synthase YwiE [Rubripirellula amarantea]
MDFYWQILDLRWTALIITASLLLVHLTAFVSAFHALQNVRTSQAAVAWVVGLVTVPYLTLPLYWVFARHRFSGYREAIREVGNQHEQSVTSIRRELFTGSCQRTTSLETPLQQVADVLDTPISSNNQFRLLIDGQAFLDAVIDQIKSASRYVYAEFYIIRDDETGRRFADALVERARAGVTVRLLYDEVGCLRLSNRFIEHLTEAGVDVHAFNTRQGWANRFQINFRNHRKFVLADGERAIVGGLNIGDEYLGKTTLASSWRDTSMEVVGPAARKIQAVFAGDYFWAARRSLPEAQWAEVVNHAEHRDQTDGLTAVCSTGPADSRPRATMMFTAAIVAAKTRVWISTPYLVPDDALLVALSMARTRGVDVRVLIPAVADHWGAYLASFHYEHELAELGVPVFRYKDGVLHQKCVLVDDSLALIGSTNLDNRSLYLNFEMMLAVDDREFVNQVETMFQKDLAASEESNGTGKPARPWVGRAGTAVARLFSPVL